MTRGDERFILGLYRGLALALMNLDGCIWLLPLDIRVCRVKEGKDLG
jgi:hypothetical protein